MSVLLSIIRNAQQAHQNAVDGMAHVIGRVLWALDTARQYVTRKVGW